MIIKNGQVALPGKDDFFKLDIKIENGKITDIAENIADENEVIDASELFVFPGGIDPHVHFNDPGYTSNEDFYHGSCSAASGGITTIIDMPSTSIPPITNKQNFKKNSLLYKKNLLRISDFLAAFLLNLLKKIFLKMFMNFQNMFWVSKHI